MNIRTDGVVSGDQTIRESLNKDAVLKYSDGTGEDTEYSLEIVEGSHSGSASVVETSHEFLEQLYGSTEITQVSVYMNDYAYTDRVIKEINQSGYQAVSPYRISAGDYNTELVQERLTWNVAVQNQATDRAHRIGQENVVTVYKLIAKDSIEEKIVELQDKKKELAEQIMESDSISSADFSKEQLLELL